MQEPHLGSARLFAFMSKRCVGIPERDRPRQRTGARPNPAAVIAALHDPLAVFLTHDLTDVVRPDDDRSHRRPACIRAIASPRSCKVVLGTGIGAYLCPHVPATPCGWTSGMSIGARRLFERAQPTLRAFASNGKDTSIRCFGARPT